MSDELTLEQMEECIDMLEEYFKTVMYWNGNDGRELILDSGKCPDGEIMTSVIADYIRKTDHLYLHLDDLGLWDDKSDDVYMESISLLRHGLDMKLDLAGYLEKTLLKDLKDKLSQHVSNSSE